MTVSRVSLNGLAPPGRPTPIVHVQANAFGDAYSAHFRLSELVLFGSLTDAIFVDGTGGMVDIDGIHVGSTGTQDFYGNVMPNVSGSVVHVASDDVVDVHVLGGFANSELPDRASSWFVGVQRVADVRGFNPIGVIPKQFGNLTVGLCGSAPSPESGLWYTVLGTPLMVFVTGGEDVSFSATDPSGVPFLEDAGAVSGLRLSISLLHVSRCRAYCTCGCRRVRCYDNFFPFISCPRAYDSLLSARRTPTAEHAFDQLAELGLWD